MTIFSTYIINKAGGLIYQSDNTNHRVEQEKTFSYPLQITLKVADERLSVSYGQRDGIRVGHVLLAINGRDVNGKKTADGVDILQYLADQRNFPVNLKFGRPPLRTNEKLMMASMFHSLYTIAVQLSPEPHSSGIQVLETDTFKLHCYQTLTGIKFLVLTDPGQGGVDGLLKRIYECYADFGLKNPFYSLDMPIRCELFDQNLQASIEQLERAGITAM